MTPAQEKLYWREWGAAHKADPSADRHELHIAALGKDKSHKAFTNEDFDEVLRTFRALSRPTDVAAQLRQLNQTKTRLIWKITIEQAALLSVVLRRSRGHETQTEIQTDWPAAAENYIKKVGRVREPDVPVPIAPLGDQLSGLDVKQLEHLRSTLAARINTLRREAGLTIHEMTTLAGLRCTCSICTKVGRAVPSAPSPPASAPPIEEPAHPF